MVGSHKAYGTIPWRMVPDSDSKQRDQVRLLLHREMQRPDSGVQPRVPDAAPIVELDDGVQRAQAAVVHVRRGSRHLAKRGSLERTAVRRPRGSHVHGLHPVSSPVRHATPVL